MTETSFGVETSIKFHTAHVMFLKMLEWLGTSDHGYSVCIEYLCSDISSVSHTLAIWELSVCFGSIQLSASEGMGSAGMRDSLRMELFPTKMLERQPVCEKHLTCDVLLYFGAFFLSLLWLGISDISNLSHTLANWEVSKCLFNVSVAVCY